MAVNETTNIDKLLHVLAAALEAKRILHARLREHPGIARSDVEATNQAVVEAQVQLDAYIDQRIELWVENLNTALLRQFEIMESKEAKTTQPEDRPRIMPDRMAITLAFLTGNPANEVSYWLDQLRHGNASEAKDRLYEMGIPLMGTLD